MVLLGLDAKFTWFPSLTKYPRECQKFTQRLGRNRSLCPKWSYRVGQPSLNEKSLISCVFPRATITLLASEGRAGHGQGTGRSGSLSLMGTYLTPLSVPGTLQVLSSYCSVPALWRTSLWPLPDGNWSSAALGTEEPLPDNNQQQEGAPGHQGALEQPWSKPSWIGASAVTAGGPAGASSRSCSCSLHPRSIRSRQGRCWWLAGPWHPSPGLPPCQSLPSCLPVLGERPQFCSL